MLNKITFPSPLAYHLERLLRIHPLLQKEVFSVCHLAVDSDGQWSGGQVSEWHFSALALKAMLLLPPHKKCRTSFCEPARMWLHNPPLNHMLFLSLSVRLNAGEKPVLTMTWLCLRGQMAAGVWLSPLGTV